MQCACVILSSVARPAVQHFSTLSYRRKDFRGKNLLILKCLSWFSLQLLSATFLILRSERDIKYMYIGLYLKYPLFLSDFNET